MKISLKRVMTYSHFVRGASEHHKGSIDLAAPIGTPIYSPGTGTVTMAKIDPEGAGGNYMDILYPNHNVRIRLMHLSKILKNKGDSVVGLELVALSGNSGSHTTGPHLHMQVYKNGRLIDPLTIFSL